MLPDHLEAPELLDFLQFRLKSSLGWALDALTKYRFLGLVLPLFYFLLSLPVQPKRHAIHSLYFVHVVE